MRKIIKLVTIFIISTLLISYLAEISKIESSIQKINDELVAEVLKSEANIAIDLSNLALQAYKKI